MYSMSARSKQYVNNAFRLDNWMRIASFFRHSNIEREALRHRAEDAGLGKEEEDAIRQSLMSKGKEKVDEEESENSEQDTVLMILGCRIWLVIIHKSASLESKWVPNFNVFCFSLRKTQLSRFPLPCLSDILSIKSSSELSEDRSVDILPTQRRLLPVFRRECQQTQTTWNAPVCPDSDRTAVARVLNLTKNNRKLPSRKKTKNACLCDALRLPIDISCQTCVGDASGIIANEMNGRAENTCAHGFAMIVLRQNWKKGRDCEKRTMEQKMPFQSLNSLFWNKKIEHWQARRYTYLEK